MNSFDKITGYLSNPRYYIFLIIVSIILIVVCISNIVAYANIINLDIEFSIGWAWTLLVLNAILSLIGFVVLFTVIIKIYKGKVSAGGGGGAAGVAAAAAAAGAPVGAAVAAGNAAAAGATPAGVAAAATAAGAPPVAAAAAAAAAAAPPFVPHSTGVSIQEMIQFADDFGIDINPLPNSTTCSDGSSILMCPKGRGAKAVDYEFNRRYNQVYG
jgi:hypothetical protein